MPGLEEQRRAELLPAGSTLLVTDARTLRPRRADHQRLGAARRHRARRGAQPRPERLVGRPARAAARRGRGPGAALQLRRRAHRARRRARAAAVRPDRRSCTSSATRDREMLEFAALLHDIGQHVSRKGHHRHAAYLVEHGELRGFEPAEVAFLAALVRHHRRGDPKSSESRFGALDPEDRVRLRKLAALLRVADGLDRGRRGGVDDLDAFVGKDLVVLRLAAHDDAELELWGARRRRELFEKVFDRSSSSSWVDHGVPARRLTSPCHRGWSPDRGTAERSPAMSPTRRELVRATRTRIVEAAGRLARERGPNGFSMDVLAKEAGVARATVYEHFRSKRAVLDELASSIARTRHDGRDPQRHQRSARRVARHARRGVPALGRARGTHERPAHADRAHRRRPGRRRHRREAAAPARRSAGRGRADARRTGRSTKPSTRWARSRRTRPTSGCGARPARPSRSKPCSPSSSCRS